MTNFDIDIKIRYWRKWSSCFGMGRGPKTFRGWCGPTPLGYGCSWHPKNMLLPHLRYHTKFGRSRSNCSSI